MRNFQKRICPNPEVIQEYLTKNTDFDETIPEDSRVCQSCYKAHLLILKQKPKGTDTNLHTLICDLKKHLLPIENLKGANDIIEHAMQST